MDQICKQTLLKSVFPACETFQQKNIAILSHNSTVSSLIQNRKPAATCAPHFKKMVLDDRKWILPLLTAENSSATYGCFGSLYMWGTSFNQTVAKIGNRLLIYYNTPKEPFFAYPSGSGSLHSAIHVMEQKAAAQGVPLIIKDITAAQKENLEKEFPNYFDFTEDRDKFDYFYEAEKLATLSGKKLHGKRNHCNRFEQDCPDWRFEDLKREHFPDCMSLFNYWAANREEQSDKDLTAERTALEHSFKNFEALGMEGGALFVGEKLVAFTLGEMSYGDSFDVHFEKAMAEMNGAFPMINREFVRSLIRRHPQLRYINREEDLGIENLRTAKLSYYPAFLMEKFVATPSMKTKS